MASQIVKENPSMNEISSSKGYLLADFWAEWCGPCKRLEPIFIDAAEQNKDIKFCRINVDSNPELASYFHIRSIPTLILFKDGQPLQTKIGGMDLVSLNAWIAQYTK